MTVLFMESFDWLATGTTNITSTHLMRKWDTSTESSSNSTIVQNGRNGTFALQLGNTGASTNNVGTFLAANESTLICGFSYARVDAGVSTKHVCAFNDVGTNQINLRTNASNILEVWRNTTLIGTATMSALATGVAHYIEMKCVFHASAGSVTLKLDGVTVLTLSGISTIGSANAYANRFYFGTVFGSANTGGDWYDDFYLLNATDQSIAQTGSLANNDFLGDCRVQCLPPNGDGNYSQFTGSDANSVNNSLLVDELPSNDDTDYVEDSVSGHRDSYAFTNLTPTSGVVYAVQIAAEAKKTDAGAMSLVLFARSSATDADGSSQPLSTTYTQYRDMRGAKPGATGWSIADVNAAEFGIKVP